MNTFKRFVLVFFTILALIASVLMIAAAPSPIRDLPAAPHAYVVNCGPTERTLHQLTYDTDYAVTGAGPMVGTLPAGTVFSFCRPSYMPVTPFRGIIKVQAEGGWTGPLYLNRPIYYTNLP